MSHYSHFLTFGIPFGFVFLCKHLLYVGCFSLEPKKIWCHNKLYKLNKPGFLSLHTHIPTNVKNSLILLKSICRNMCTFICTYLKLFLSVFLPVVTCIFTSCTCHVLHIPFSLRSELTSLFYFFFYFDESFRFAGSVCQIQPTIVVDCTNCSEFAFLPKWVLAKQEVYFL